MGPPVGYPPVVASYPLRGHSHSREDQRADSPSEPDSGLPSEPSPDDTVGDPDPVSSNKDLRLYTEQMMRMAKSLELEVTPTYLRPCDKILGKLYTDLPGIIAFSVLEGIDISMTLAKTN